MVQKRQCDRALAARLHEVAREEAEGVRVAAREVEGLDFGVTYKTSLENLGLPDWGTLAIRSLYTNTWLYTITPDEISAPVKCADKFGNRCRGFGVNP